MGSIYIQYEYWFAAFQLVFAMLGMGATLTTDDFKDVVREPRAVALGTTIQLIVPPILAFIFIHAFGVTAGVAIGLALIAAIPGGTTSNIFTYMARGNVPLSISITGLTTFACLITTPLILGLLVTEYLPTDFAMPTGQIIRDIVLILLLPLVLGMLILQRFSRYAAAISTWSIRLSLLGLLFIVVGSASAGRLDVDAFGNDNIALVFAFIVTFAIVTWVLSRSFQLSKSDSTAIEIEVIVRNVNLGVLIKASLFPAAANHGNHLGDFVLFTILLYGTLQMLFAAVLITLRRRTVVKYA